MKIQDLFVPFDIAVIAKQKRFNEQCLTTYHTGILEPLNRGYFNNDSLSLRDSIFAAPTYQQIINWFDSQKIYICPIIIIDNSSEGKDEWGFELNYFKRKDKEHKIKIP